MEERGRDDKLDREAACSDRNKLCFKCIRTMYSAIYRPSPQFLFIFM